MKNYNKILLAVGYNAQAILRNQTFNGEGTSRETVTKTVAEKNIKVTVHQAWGRL